MAYLENVIAVLCGGAVGAVSRYELDGAVIRAVGAGFPYGILLINVLGGFLMGLLQGWIKRSGSPHAVLYSLLGTGFLGGFTTISHFALNTFHLFQGGDAFLALLNVILNAGLAIGAAAWGYLLTRPEASGTVSQ